MRRIVFSGFIFGIGLGLLLLGFPYLIHRQVVEEIERTTGEAHIAIAMPVEEFDSRKWIPDLVPPDSALMFAKELAKEFEGVRLKAYRDPVGRWTVGYGHSIFDSTASLTLSEADSLLDVDMRLALNVVDSMVTICCMNVYQRAALADFVFNEGRGHFHRSTLLFKLNGHEWAHVPDELRLWIYAGGEILPGLVRRREAEIDMWHGNFR